MILVDFHLQPGIFGALFPIKCNIKATWRRRSAVFFIRLVYGIILEANMYPSERFRPVVSVYSIMGCESFIVGWNGLKVLRLVLLGHI